jgi:hypothetical protein
MTRRDIQVGDVIARGVGENRMLNQVVEIDGDNITFRRIAKPNGPFVYMDGQTDTGYFPFGSNFGNALRPTEHAPKDYFKSLDLARANRAANAPEVRNDYAPRAAELRNRIEHGYSIKTKIAHGAINQGAYFVQPNDNGDEVFMKYVNTRNDNREWHNEIVVSKMLNALGVTDVVVTGLADKRTIVQDKIRGKMAAEKRYEAHDILSHLGDYKNGRLIGLVDYLTVNSDRHMGNWFVGDTGEPIPIDHGYTWFDDTEYLNATFAAPALGRLLGERMYQNQQPMFTKEELVQMKAQIAAIRDEFLANGNPHGQKWYQFVLSRFDSLISKY